MLTSHYKEEEPYADSWREFVCVVSDYVWSAGGAGQSWAAVLQEHQSEKHHFKQILLR